MGRHQSYFKKTCFVSIGLRREGIERRVADELEVPLIDVMGWGTMLCRGDSLWHRRLELCEAGHGAPERPNVERNLNWFQITHTFPDDH